MAEDRTNPAPPADAAAGAAASGGGFKVWLPLIITIVLMPVLALAMTQFVLLPQLQKQLGGNVVSNTPAVSKTKSDNGKEKPVSVTMSKVLVNVAGTMGARYLMVTMSVVGSGEDFKAKIDEHDAQLRDMACGVLGSKSLTDLEKPGERNLVRNELIAGFNNILGDSTVHEIYFPEFAIQ